MNAKSRMISIYKPESYCIAVGFQSPFSDCKPSFEMHQKLRESAGFRRRTNFYCMVTAERTMVCSITPMARSIAARNKAYCPGEYLPPRCSTVALIFNAGRCCSALVRQEPNGCVKDCSKLLTESAWKPSGTSISTALSNLTGASMRNGVVRRETGSGRR